MYTKLLSGASYDVLVPSDYMVERLIKEKLIQPIDKSIVTNLDVLTDGAKNLDCDPDNTYMVPYLWQTVGILYDTTKIDPAEVEEKGFSIYHDPKYAGHAYMYDSERDSFMMAFKALGYSANTENEDEIQEAFEWLREADKAVQPAYVTDEVIDAMAEALRLGNSRVFNNVVLGMAARHMDFTREEWLKVIEETNRLIFFTHSFGYKGEEQQTKGDKAGKE